MYENVIRQNRFVFFYEAIKRSSISALDGFIIISIIKLCCFSISTSFNQHESKASLGVKKSLKPSCCLAKIEKQRLHIYET
jgi:hypothetical protein